MTIRKGGEWGRQVPAAPDLVWVHTDREIVTTPPPVAVAGGDLHRSVGSPPRRDPLQRVEIDGLRVVVDDGEAHSGIAHVVMRRSWWRGPIVVVMNVDHLGDRYVAPRAHPNDGSFDVVEVAPEMSLRQRWSARSRLATGDHLPHPQISTRRERQHTWTFERAVDVWIDGVRVCSGRSVFVELQPDRYVVHF